MSSNAPGPQSGVPVGTDQLTYATLRDRPTISIPIPSTTADLILVGRPCILCGWSIRENAGAAAGFDFHAGPDNTGLQVGSQALASGGNSLVGPGVDGPYCPGGLRIQVTSGTVKGAVWVKV